MNGDMNIRDLEKILLESQKQNKMRKLKITFTTFPGLCVGIGFPWTDYSDMYITLLFFGIHFKWRKR